MGWDGIYCGYGVATNQSYLCAGQDNQFTEGSKGQALENKTEWCRNIAIKETPQKVLCRKKYCLG